MRHFRLPNGIPVVLAPMDGTSVVTSLVLFHVGSRYETPRLNGVSHFIEHLFFKGTERRPTTLHISQELDGIGSEFNAFTSKDYTGYYVKAAARHVPLVVDILEDILFHPIFDPKEIDRERNVIIEEINMYEDNPMVVAEELAEQLLFGAHHPLGYRIAGPHKNIREVSHQAIIAYRNQYYHSKNMVIVLAGNIAPATASVIRGAFGHSPRPTRPTPHCRSFIYTQRAPRSVVHHKPTAQSHVAISFPAPTYTSPVLPVAQVLSALLGGSMSSRLFINVRERQGLCYYINSSVSPYTDAGAFTIQAGFDTSRVHDACAAIIQQLQEIRRTSVGNEELQKAKEFLCGKMSIRMEDSEEQAAWWGRQALFSRSWPSPVQHAHAIQLVTARQVQQLAQRLFQRSSLNAVLVGPHDQRAHQRLHGIVSSL